MKAVQIEDRDLEGGLSIDYRPIVVQFANSGDRDQKSARGGVQDPGLRPSRLSVLRDRSLEHPSAAERYELDQRLFISDAVMLVFVNGVERIRPVGV